ncbi:MAG: NAD-dependent dehydratase [Candidatus Pelagibacter sp.]|nr:NAD-dependent dehydratase [Candidatus Pelagibacter sp.]
MKIIVTGGAGFIGSNLVDALVKKKHKIIVIDNLVTGQKKNLLKSKKAIKFLKTDINNLTNNQEKIFKNSDCVFHLAGLADIVPSILNPEKYFKANVNGTLKILEISKKYKVKKLIYAASASCYGIPKKYPTSEKDVLDLQYPYAITKKIGEDLVLKWAKIYKMNNSSLRFFNVYGPRSRTTGAYGAVFGVFLAQKLKNKPLTIVGNGKQTRDFVHVTDLVNALIKSIKKTKKGEIYNIGSGKEVSVNKIALLIGGKKIFIPKRPGEPTRSKANINKIKKTLNWRPLVSIESGVKMMLNNIENWKDAPVWTPNKINKATKAWFKFLK